MIAIVVAVAENGVIGSRNDLPWYLPADLKHFKKVTSGHTVVMGRTTFESIVARLGKPLPNRKNVVLSRDKSFEHKGASVIHDIQEIATLAEDVYVIGGAQVYAAMLSSADMLYVTQVHANISGDAHFPGINPAQWQEVSRESHVADERNQYDYDFVVYKRCR
ncbi:dihydrofolate reductase [Candidatus Saccharibacteria bacterium]|nr:MAG: dihydrofolate reductase [Candidatus Saccharibacteria bacterium]